MFMLILDSHDMKNVIKATKNFIKIYIEKDIIEEDSFTQFSVDSSNYSDSVQEKTSKDHNSGPSSFVSKHDGEAHNIANDKNLSVSFMS